MFRTFALLGVCSLFVFGACDGSGGALRHTATTISIEDLLTAHRVDEDRETVSVFIAEAIRTVSLTAIGSGKGSATFARLIRVARKGSLFRYERTSDSSTKQIDLFDGNAVHHLMSANGRLIDSSTRPGESASEQVMLEIKTFGVLPILNRLMSSKPQSVFE